MIDKILLFKYHNYVQTTEDVKVQTFNEWMGVNGDDDNQEPEDKEQQLHKIIKSKKRVPKLIYNYFVENYKDSNEYNDIF
jgi:hypothetical protein